LKELFSVIFDLFGSWTWDLIPRSYASAISIAALLAPLIYAKIKSNKKIHLSYVGIASFPLFWISAPWYAAISSRFFRHINKCPPWSNFQLLYIALYIALFAFIILKSKSKRIEATIWFGLNLPLVFVEFLLSGLAACEYA
jgi:hypothetical protein